MSILLTFVTLFIGMIGYRILVNQKKPLAALAEQQERLREVVVQQFLAEETAHKIPIDGRLVAAEKVNFFANVSGILLPSSKVLKEGTYVQKGELLFDIDQRKAMYNLHAQRSQLLHLLTLIIPDLKLDYPDAYEKWQAYLDAFEVEKPIQALPSISNEQEKYFVASKNIQQLYYSIKSLEANLTDFKIYSPFTGAITQANTFPGTMVNPGQPLGAMINTSLFELETPIAEVDLPYIKVGNRALLYSDAAAIQWKGTVRRISNQIDPFTQNVPVFIEISGKELKEGMFLQGHIEGIPLAQAVSLPKDIIVNQEYVFTVEDSIIHLFHLAIERRDNEQVYVTNLAAATWVVSSSPDGLFEGQKVIPKQRNEIRD